MMGLDDRIMWLLVGGVIGFVVGYIVRSLRDIKEKVDEVDHNVKLQKDEGGLMEIRYVRDVALFFVVALTAYAAFVSQKASNTVSDAQVRQGEISSCHQRYLSQTIEALNERTTYTVDQAAANVELQKDQAAFWTLLLQQPPASDKTRRNAAEEYLESLTEFVAVSGKTQAKVEDYPFPTNEDLYECLGYK